MRTLKHAGATAIEVMVVLVIIAALAAMMIPDAKVIRQKSHVLACQAQLNEISVALRSYRGEHQGRVPEKIGELVPKYLDQKNLVCPFTQLIAPERVRQRKMIAEKFKRTWSTYFLFPIRVLDGMKEKGRFEFGYSDVLKQRGEDTPLVYCREHRESYSLYPGYLAKKAKDAWYFPEAPIVVLRWGGKVDQTMKGGTIRDQTSMGTLQDLQDL